ncbi:hypothetical protein J6590_011220 [Homalodisca vitripennis]|nr:hypothetical protein J6590_011220 [Homalodisca vitripennis]
MMRETIAIAPGIQTIKSASLLIELRPNPMDSGREIPTAGQDNLTLAHVFCRRTTTDETDFSIMDPCRQQLTITGKIAGGSELKPLVLEEADLSSVNISAQFMVDRSHYFLRADFGREIVSRLSRKKWINFIDRIYLSANTRQVHLNLTYKPDKTVPSSTISVLAITVIFLTDGSVVVDGA